MKSGILLLNKPTGTSSAKALYPVKRRFKGRKIGHTGTLDPFASGLLVVLVGQATRLSRFFLSLDKRYRAIVRFGIETDTLDPEGTVIREAPLPDRSTVVERATELVGAIKQVPPVFSALKVDGQRAYKKARAGEQFEMPPRTVSVYSLRMTETTDRSRWTMDLHCGSGTYVRSIARDLGSLSKSAAMVEALERTAVGPFDLTQAIKIDDIDDARGVDNEVPLFSTTEAIRRLQTIPIISLDEGTVQAIRAGRPAHSVFPGIESRFLEMTPREAGVPGRDTSTEYLCTDSQDRAAALVRYDSSKEKWSYNAVFSVEEFP